MNALLIKVSFLICVIRFSLYYKAKIIVLSARRFIGSKKFKIEFMSVNPIIIKKLKIVIQLKTALKMHTSIIRARNTGIMKKMVAFSGF
jgi:hypothetical protein